jgi:hypothetical protein
MDFSQGIPVWLSFILYILVLWSLAWKGIALWRAAKYEQRNWFIVMLAFTLIVNTLGILEIVYLFRFAKKRMTIAEVKTWFKKTFFTKSADKK